MGNLESRQGADVLVTGIPRSGTSYFCTLLHNLQDCVAINEPEEIFRHLNDTFPPWGMRAYYGSLRSDILARRPISNKIHDGRLIEDTAVVQHEELYSPEVTSPGFLLATKNTLAYLARLPLLARAMPEAAIVACIRNPFDAIASWKGTFEHLAGASVRQIRLGFVGDPLLRPEARARVQEIDSEGNVERKRAMFWRHLAHLMLEDRNQIAQVLRYEDLVSDPERHLKDLFTHIANVPAFRPIEPFHPSSARKARSSILTTGDIEVIREVCGDAAAAFGYDLRAARP